MSTHFTTMLYPMLSWEPFTLICLLVLSSWGAYKIFLRSVSAERHKNLRNQFAQLFRHAFYFIVVFVTLQTLFFDPVEKSFIGRAAPYLAVITFVMGAYLFVRSSRLLLLQYMFLGSMRAGVPVLLVNIYSLILSILIFLWASTKIFGWNLAPLLATSAAFSIILGLAMQDTLGNLFAGISLQIDRSFEIGDWVEVLLPTGKVVGLVDEMTWRSTTLRGWTDEQIVIPNRAMATAHILNFQSGDSPIYRSQMFRLPYGADVTSAQTALLAMVVQVPGVRHQPAPVCLATENHESWIGLKLAYSIDDYGAQYRIGHEVLTRGLQVLAQQGIQVTSPRLYIESKPL